MDILHDKIDEQEIHKNSEIQALINKETDQVSPKSNSEYTIYEPELDDKKVKYKKAARNFLEEQKRKSDNILIGKHQEHFWKIGNTVYSTQDKKIVDLGYGKYCIIDQSLEDLEQYAIYQRTMEKGFLYRAQGNGVKFAGNTCEIKIYTQDHRLHNNNLSILIRKEKTYYFY